MTVPMQPLGVSLGAQPPTSELTSAFRDVSHALEWVELVRRRLTQLLVVRWTLIAVALGLALVALLAMVSRVAPLSRLLVIVLMGTGLGTIAMLVAITMRRHQITTQRAALWIEEQIPLHYGMVTLVERHAPRSGEPSATVARELDAGFEAVLSALNRDSRTQGDVRARIHKEIAQSARRLWRAPAVTGAVLLGALLAAAFLLALRTPGTHGKGITAPSLLRGAAAVIPVTPSWRVAVFPPAYTGRPTSTVGDVDLVEGIEGSTIRVQYGDSLRVLSMPERPTTVDVVFGTTRRVFALVPQPDSLPAVSLLSPQADSVYRDSAGRVVLSARATDDFGLASMVFDVIVTSGEGERYDARRLSLGARTLRGARNAEQVFALPFTELSLRAGDIVHVRAVAYDRNPRAGRAPGVSETRSFRIARASEYDSVAVEGAPPPPVDSSLMSQRMLLLLTERLQRQRPRLEQPALVRESRKLALDQARLRRAVSAVVFQRFGSEAEAEHVHYEGDGHEHGVAVVGGRLVESSTEAARAGGDADAAIIAVNRPLLEAYNAMWDAGRELELAEPRNAIPHMQRALEAIQRARAAERLYLRGRVRPVVVDLARVRLAGRDTGQSSRRTAATGEETVRARLDARVSQAAERYAADHQPELLRDTLFVLRVEMLSVAPDAASVLGELLRVLRAPGSSSSVRGDEVTDRLVQARRALLPPAAYRGPVSAWSIP